VKLLAGLSTVPRVGSATAEDFAVESGRALGAETPAFTPGAMIPLADADLPQIALRVPALRRAANAVAALSVLATPAFMDGSAYPSASIDELRAALQTPAGPDPSAAANEIVLRAESALASELEILARGAETLGKGTPIVAFNTLPWPRTALIQLDSSSGSLFGSDGAPLPSQTTAAGSRLFALDVPALGYHVVRGSRGDVPAQLDERERVRVDGWTARNSRLSFTVDPTTGALASLALVGEKLELLARPAQLAGDGWKTESVAFTEKGPLRAVARVALSAGERQRRARIPARSALGPCSKSARGLLPRAPPSASPARTSDRTLSSACPSPRPRPRRTRTESRRASASRTGPRSPTATPASASWPAIWRRCSSSVTR
jgi:hypothetical protein